MWAMCLFLNNPDWTETATNKKTLDSLLMLFVGVAALVSLTACGGAAVAAPPPLVMTVKGRTSSSIP